MKHLQTTRALIYILIFSVSFASCTKEDISNSDDTTNITVKLKSTIGQLDKVFIDIEDVQFKVKEDENSPNAWISLNTINQGTYNACHLNEESSLLLVDHIKIESTFIHEIRLVLGDNNFMDVNGLLMSLDISDLGNATPSNLIKTELLANKTYEFVIDMDIDESIHFNEDQNMMVLNPKLYTAIRQFEY
ncbi:DUF4382 domain-containing protein [Winogradskyella luteola]|uniref:DUF4382 domain-containing protein n=1 Tax=Winogradskyella luteola TaxID=2828330 RepID=A0A9X1F7P5_9FLAO|nr:DUF4382 domain-containing protein [Winogradskyella luteola]MBV7268967.1 DUF4382 domain-containing protein [Winogradskyella luteola]